MHNKRTIHACRRQARCSRAGPQVDALCPQFDVQLRIALGQLTLRGSNQAHLIDGQLQSNVAHLEAGYRLSDSVTAIAGIRHGVEDPQASSVLVDRNKGTWLEAGVQVKGVPLVVGYRPEDGSVSVGVTIPF